jgi:hypothetical protein
MENRYETWRRQDDICKWTYKDNLKNQQYNHSDEYGEITYKNGDVYKGNLKNGKKEGSGEMIFANKNIYNGQWRTDMKHGEGKMTYANGDVYQGTWWDDCRNGQGFCYYASPKDIYDGEWANNMKLGRGKMTYANGNIYNGEWLNNKKEDKNGQMTYANGNIYTGCWTEGVTKFGTMKYADKNPHQTERSIQETDEENNSDRVSLDNGDRVNLDKRDKVDFTYTKENKYTGDWKDNKRHGKKGILWYNGTKYEGQWKEDMQHGLGKETYKNGNMFDGIWKNGRKHGKGTISLINKKNAIQLDIKTKIHLDNIIEVSSLELIYYIDSSLENKTKTIKLACDTGLCVAQEYPEAINKSAEKEYHFLPEFIKKATSLIQKNILICSLCRQHDKTINTIDKQISNHLQKENSHELSWLSLYEQQTPSINMTEIHITRER